MMSGNTLHAKRWTDGYMFAPMLLEQPDLIKCPHCEALLWIEGQEEVGEYDGNKIAHREYRSAAPFRELTLKDYLGYLEKGDYPADRERYLRLQTWWTGNDEHRRNTEVQMYMSEAEKANLESLIQLLDDEDQSDQLMKAEAYREMGRFDEAKEVLLQSDPSFAPEAGDQIWQLSVQRDVFVKEIPSD